MTSDDHEFRYRWVSGWAGPEDAEILARDAKWTLHQANNRPGLLAVRAAQGSFIEDHAGRRYLDLHGNNRGLLIKP